MATFTSLIKALKLDYGEEVMRELYELDSSNDDDGDDSDAAFQIDESAFARGRRLRVFAYSVLLFISLAFLV